MILDFFSCCGTVASVMAAQNDIMTVSPGDRVEIVSIVAGG